MRGGHTKCGRGGGALERASSIITSLGEAKGVLAAAVPALRRIVVVGADCAATAGESVRSTTAGGANWAQSPFRGSTVHETTERMVRGYRIWYQLVVFAAQW